MWLQIANELQIYWLDVELMHWELGPEKIAEMARRHVTTREYKADAKDVTSRVCRFEAS